MDYLEDCLIMSKPKSLNHYIDLRGTPCPVNYVRCCLEIEELNHHDILEIDLDKGEPKEMVFNGLKQAGHHIKVILDEVDWVRLLVVCCAHK